MDEKYLIEKFGTHEQRAEHKLVKRMYVAANICFSIWPLYIVKDHDSTWHDWVIVFLLFSNIWTIIIYTQNLALIHMCKVNDDPVLTREIIQEMPKEFMVENGELKPSLICAAYFSQESRKYWNVFLFFLVAVYALTIWIC